MILSNPKVEEYVECLNINRECFDLTERAPDGIFLNRWDNGVIFIAYGGSTSRGNRIIGFAVVTNQNGTPFLWVIAVRPDSRRHGVAGRLLEEIQDWAVSNSKPKIELTVKSTNPAQKLYFDAGYRVVKFLRGYYPDGDGLLMRRKI
jgi:ribosomal protein S18 acetylase RimI-like enzyme